MRRPLFKRRTKAERQERWDVCIRYLRRTGSIPAAKKAAKLDGYTFDGAVWITALSRILESLGKC